MWAFIAATAMATTVSTVTATALTRNEPAPPEPAPPVTCACECGEEEPAMAPPPRAIVDGALDRDMVRRIVRAHINEVRECYNAALLKDPQVSGQVEIMLGVAGDGKVERTEPRATTLPTAVGECISAAARGWKFPRPSDGQPVEIVYPFVLEPG
jgi:hypothetical protein